MTVKGRKGLKAFILIIAGIVLLMTLEIVRETHSFRVIRYAVSAPCKMKIIFLSDLHNQCYGEKNQKLLAAIEREKPDMILIGGDMLVGKNGYDSVVAEEFVEALSHFCPVYYANGNHEQRMKETPEKYDLSYLAYKEKLEKAGIQFLENSSVSITSGQAKMRITALEIPRYCYKRLGKGKLRQEDMEERIGKADSSCFQILLAHNPCYMDEYVEWGADLVLSGHLHGGIVRIPGLSGVIAPDLQLFPRYSGGYYTKGKTQIVVSKGLGMHTIPIRLFNPAEVVVLELAGRSLE